MNILHSESSKGWGGQEMRILREAEGMRERGHEIIFVVNMGAALIPKARQKKFKVYEILLDKKHAVQAILKIVKIIHYHQIDIINTHSSFDAWVGGLSGRLAGIKILRTRHLSTPIRQGWNSRLLYNWLADATVTTCKEVAKIIGEQAKLPPNRCCSVPTGVSEETLHVDPCQVEAFKQEHGILPQDFIIGTVCFLRSWKGVIDFLHAAKLLQAQRKMKWVIVGSGPSENWFKSEWKRLELEKQVIFTGHLDNPFSALAAFDIFALLSTANEGVSQASLQAAYLQKPLIATKTGGLPEVCIEGVTGFTVNNCDAEGIAKSVMALYENPALRTAMGKEAHQLVKNRFTISKTLDHMEAVYQELKG